jgi:hypothetical protein
MRYGRLLLFLAALLFASAVTPSLHADDPPPPGCWPGFPCKPDSQ